MNIARLAYPRLLQGAPGLGVSLGVLAAMGISWLGLLVLLAWSWRQPEPAPLMRSTPAEQQAFDRQREAQPAQIQAKLAHDAFLARYQALPDPEAKWALLERHEEEDMEESGFDPAHLDWLEQQRAVLLGQLPADHPGALWHRLNQAGPGSPGATETLLAVIAQLGASAGGKAANLDEKRFEVLMESYRWLAKEASPATLAAQKPALDALWSALEGYDPEGAARLRAELADARGKHGSKLPPFAVTSDGWGKAREAAHGKLLKALDVAP